MDAPDWLAALDDVLVERLTHCTMCGRRCPRGWMDVWTGPTLSIAYLRCTQCRDRDPASRAMETLLARRYAPQAGDPACITRPLMYRSSKVDGRRGHGAVAGAHEAGVHVRG